MFCSGSAFIVESQLREPAGVVAHNSTDRRRRRVQLEVTHASRSAQSDLGPPSSRFAKLRIILNKSGSSSESARAEFRDHENVIRHVVLASKTL